MHFWKKKRFHLLHRKINLDNTNCVVCDFRCIASPQDLVQNLLIPMNLLCQWTGPAGLLLYHWFATVTSRIWTYPLHVLLLVSYRIYSPECASNQLNCMCSWKVCMHWHPSTSHSNLHLIGWFFMQALAWNQTPLLKCEPACGPHYPTMPDILFGTNCLESHISVLVVQ